MLGLANPVAGPSRGTLFREVSIFLVVVRDAEPKKRRNLFSKLYVYKAFFCQWSAEEIKGQCSVMSVY